MQVAMPNHPEDIGTLGATQNVYATTGSPPEAWLEQDNHLRPPVQKSYWSTTEDRLLKELVEMYGAKNWSRIAKSFQGRIGKQCRERWRNHLNPAIRKDPFTPEEDKRILELVDEVGTKWTQIAARLPGRTDNSIKNRFYSSLKRTHAQNASLPANVSAPQSAPRSTLAVPVKPHRSPTSPQEAIATVPISPKQTEVVLVEAKRKRDRESPSQFCLEGAAPLAEAPFTYVKRRSPSPASLQTSPPGLENTPISNSLVLITRPTPVMPAAARSVKPAPQATVTQRPSPPLPSSAYMGDVAVPLPALPFVVPQPVAALKAEAKRVAHGSEEFDLLWTATHSLCALRRHAIATQMT